MNSKAKSTIQTLLKVALAAGLIWWILATGKLDIRSLQNLLSARFLAVGLLLVLGNICTIAYRWKLILATQGENLSYLETVRLTFIGLFFNYAMPGGVGGDVVKAFYLFRERPRVKAAAITSVLMDRILGLYAMIFMALGVMIWDSNHVLKIPTLEKLLYFLILLFFVASLFLYLAFSGSIFIQKQIHFILNRLPMKSKFIKLYESTHLYGKFPGVIAFAVAISVVAQTFSILFLISAGEASGLGDIPISTYFIVAPLGFMAIAIPISPAGLGVGQAAFYALFNIYLEKTTALGPTVITALQALQVLFGLAGAGFYLVKKSPVAEDQILQEMQKES